ncbi:uncharacterized protein TNCV_3734061 [Trichonephila clavipes]|nr:uncharacterized protein TNCV_3734031 [Trichonephila clavipes]GFU51900.1 uncharacterized protein TNCV_3734061 [Trichonephila clavipes]
MSTEQLEKLAVDDGRERQRDDRHLLRMAVNERTASSRQLAARWSTATGVLMLASSTSAAPWIVCKGAFIQDPPHGKPSTAALAMGS